MAANIRDVEQSIGSLKSSKRASTNVRRLRIGYKCAGLD